MNRDGFTVPFHGITKKQGLETTPEDKLSHVGLRDSHNCLIILAKYKKSDVDIMHLRRIYPQLVCYFQKLLEMAEEAGLKTFENIKRIRK